MLSLISKNKKFLLNSLAYIFFAFFMFAVFSPHMKSSVWADNSTEQKDFCHKTLQDNSPNPDYDSTGQNCQKFQDCGFDDNGVAKPCSSGGGTLYQCGNDQNGQCDKDIKDVCGKGTKRTEMKFNFGCLGKDYPTDPPDKNVSPVQDLAFAFVRFFSAGVGVVVVISVIIAGIRYSASQANPQATAGAIAQIRNALIGLVIYIFMYALIQFLVPGGAFN